VSEGILSTVLSLPAGARPPRSTVYCKLTSALHSMLNSAGQGQAPIRTRRPNPIRTRPRVSDTAWTWITAGTHSAPTRREYSKKRNQTNAALQILTHITLHTIYELYVPAPQCTLACKHSQSMSILRARSFEVVAARNDSWPSLTGIYN